MGFPTKEEFSAIIAQFVDGDLSAPEFERLYLEMFKNDRGFHAEAEFKILDSLFGDVDAFTSDPTLRDPGDLDENQLRARATRALESLRLTSTRAAP